MPRLRDLPDRIERAIWGVDPHAIPGWKAPLLQAVRMVVILVRDLAGGQLTLRAMSLVYTTLLSIVPLLALSFSVLKGFGVYNQLEPMLLNFLEPLGEKGEEVARRIVQFIENMNVGVLGALGMGLLLYTAISLMQKIEESLNFIWHIPRPRRFAERFGRYLSVLLVGPLLVFSSLGITATVMNLEAVRDALAIDVLSQAVYVVGRLTPYLLVIAAFTFVYLYVPNTRVRFGPALVGGIAGGIAWQTAGWAFALFVASSGKYAAIYSSFAILVLFMIWLYLSWLILLFGASVAFYCQHPEHLFARAGEPQMSSRMRERVALSVMSLAAGRFVAGEPALSMGDLARALGVPAFALHAIIDPLEQRGLLLQSGDDPPAYLPARDPSLVSVGQVLEAVRSAGEERYLSPEALLPVPQVSDVLERLQSALDASVAEITLRDLAAQPSARAPRRPAVSPVPLRKE